MRKLALGIGAAALVASAAFAGDETTTTTTTQTDQTQVAAIDTSSGAWSKLDADHDGRVSAIEAANDTKLAAAFTQADTNKDGYLSPEEFKSLSSSSMDKSATTPAPQSDTTTAPADSTTPPADTTTQPPQK